MDTISREQFSTAKSGLYKLDEPAIFRDKVFDVSSGEFVQGYYQKFVRVREGMGDSIPEGLGLETHIGRKGNLIIVQEGLVEQCKKQ